MGKLNYPRTAKIKNEYLKSFSNSLHVQFHFQQHELVARTSKEKIKVSDKLLKEWEECIELETDINKKSAMSEVTKKLTEQDKVRDDALNNIFGVIRSQRFSPINEVKEAAEKLYAAFKPYFGTQFKPLPEESADIRGMMVDTVNFPTEIDKLGLKKSFELLKAANDTFEELRMQRQDNQIDDHLPSAREARKHTDEVYEEICHCISAAYLMAENQADKDIVIILVNELNTSGDAIRKSHSESIAMKKAAKKKKEENKETE
ncbi:MAG: hypothetical protein HXN43_02840 [Prevotella micans]|jgi:hypothetical protein|nr:hypothetical protein [Prevotella micans]